MYYELTLIESFLPVPDLQVTAWNSIEAFFIAASKIEEAWKLLASDERNTVDSLLYATPWQCRHPELGLVS